MWQNRTGARADRHHGRRMPRADERAVGGLLGRRADGQLHGGALLLLAGQQRGEVVHGEPRVGAGQQAVLGVLDAGSAVDGVVAGDRGVGRPLRVVALEGVGPLDRHRLGDLEVGAVAIGDDRAALVGELLVEAADVAGLVSEVGGVEPLYPVDVDQQQHEHGQAGQRDTEQRAVHPARTTWVMPSSWIGCGAGPRAPSLTRISRATRIQLATSDDPPSDRNGVVTPVSGIRPLTPPTITNTCRASTKDSPPTRSLENGSLTPSAARSPRWTSRPKISSRAMTPTRPSSSPKAVKMKSLCTSGV